MKTTQHLFKLGLSGLKQLRPSPKQFSSASSRSISSSSTMAANSERMLRLSISHYKADSKTEAECHKFGTEDHAVKAAAIHAKHGIQMYAQYHTPSSTRKVLEAMNAQRNRGWVIDDHDITIEFYFKDFAALTAVGQDPEFQTLQAEEEPYISRTHTVASLGWVEVFVQDGKVVNIANGKPTYGTFADVADITAPAQPRKSEA